MYKPLIFFHHHLVENCIFFTNLIKKNRKWKKSIKNNIMQIKTKSLKTQQQNQNANENADLNSAANEKKKNHKYGIALTFAKDKKKTQTIHFLFF